MKPNFLLHLVGIAFVGLLSPAQAISLGTAQNFAVLANTTATNTGNSVIINGHVGVSPGSAIVGFPPGIITPPFTTHSANATSAQAQVDLAAAFTQAVGLAVTSNLTGQDLGSLSGNLTPGVYFFSSSAGLTGNLILDGQNDPNAEWVFQIGSTLTTATNSMVTMINTGGALPGCNVFWAVGTSATLGTGTDFMGHILANVSITLTTGADILYGSALALNGAVTLDTNMITNCIPEPGSMSLVWIGCGLLAMRSRSRRGVGPAPSRS